MLRSFLVVPAVKLDRFWEHLRTLDADATPDAVVLDLEDSIPPDRKSEATEFLSTRLGDGLPALAKPVRIVVKVDNPRSPHGPAQLERLREHASRFDGIKIGKLEEPEELEAFDARFGDAGLGLIPTLETPAGYANREALVRACRSRGVRYVSFGAGDMASALLVRRSYDRDVLRHVFLGLAVTTAAHSMLFVDSPSRVIPATRVPSWQAEIARECAWSFANGAKGKTSVHPAQIPLIHEAWAAQFDTAPAEQVEARFAAEPRQRSLVDEATGEYMGTPSLAAARRMRALAAMDTGLMDRR